MHKRPTKKNNLSSWLSYIEKLHPSTIELTLDRVLEVKKNAAIEPKFPLILVGGTNGKGSTCTFIESILYESDLKVGCYTSPHFNNFSERIRVNKNQAEDLKIIEALNFVEDNREDISLTYFEITTLAAINIFINENIDIAVLEVGLGGRLDAVNAFEPDVSILSSVGLDHQDYLGDTIEKIAVEKSGIFRRNKPAIINQEKPLPILLNQAEKIQAQPSILNLDYSLAECKDSLMYESNISKYDNLPYPRISGQHQLKNLAGALRCIDFIQDYFKITTNNIKSGIENAKIRGRYDVVCKKPYVVTDVAHNGDASLSLSTTFLDHKNKGKTIAIFSIMNDKDIKSVVKPFLHIIDEWYISKLDSLRSASISHIKSEIESEEKSTCIKKYDSINSAYQDALKNSEYDDNILIFGSFLVVSEIIHEN